MSESSNAGIIQVGEERWIPGSQRSDGSYRKERKVRPGFTPQEDVKRYTNAKIETANSPKLPPGMKTKPEIPGIKKKAPAPAKKETKPVPPAPSTESGGEQTAEKKIKALNKKIRQIADLEQKLIKGEKLNEEQQEKVKKGKSLREELAKLSVE